MYITVARTWQYLPEDIEPGESIELDDGTYTLLDQDDHNKQIWQFIQDDKIARFKCVGQRGEDLASDKVVGFDPICAFYNVNY